MPLDPSQSTMPPEAVQGKTKKQESDSLSAAERDAALAQVRNGLGAAQQYIKPNISPQATVQTLLPFSNRITRADLMALVPTSPTSPLADVIAGDADEDMDKLPDKFERKLANAFMPLYHVSGGERDVFCTLKDQQTLAVEQLLQSQPPVVHFRAKKLGFVTGRDGRQYGLIQVDYLTVLNNDGGLEVSTLCRFLSPALGLTLDGLAAHPFDEERSAALLFAPATAGPSGPEYSTNVASYQVAEYYTAAHEGVTVFDHSAYVVLLDGNARPVSAPAGFHLELGLSRAKHGTYPFNPSGFPIFRSEIIKAVFRVIASLRSAGLISDRTYFALLYAAYTVLFECVVERFQDQGGLLPSKVTNVGELKQPINRCSWILDPRIRGKLDPTRWYIENGQIFRTW